MPPIIYKINMLHSFAYKLLIVFENMDKGLTNRHMSALSLFVHILEPNKFVLKCPVKWHLCNYYKLFLNKSFLLYSLCLQITCV